MSKRVRLALFALLLLLLALLFLLLPQCKRRTVAPTPVAKSAGTPSAPLVASPAPPPATVDEVLTPATLHAPATVMAGAPFTVQVVGPNNQGDFVTVVRRDARNIDTGSYKDAHENKDLELLAPVTPGDYEVRYVTTRTRTILGRVPVVVTEASATLNGPEQAILGTTISVAWTGPNNPGDYVTVVSRSTPDGRYGNYTHTAKGSPVTLTVPVDAGDAELRYMTGQGHKVLARRAIKIASPEVSLSAPDRVEAGATFEMRWTGPNNPGDYVTIVPKDLPDGRYANYVKTDAGEALKLLALITPGEAELRYMTGTGARVLTRRPITLTAAVITLDAPAEVAVGETVSITWTGPNYSGDYITVVPVTLPDGQYRRYADTGKGSPLKVGAPDEAGAAEIRYVSGQGSKTLARRPIRIVAK